MNNDSPSGGEFKWPPTSDELDAIEVIKLDDASPARQLASVPKAVVARRRQWQWNRPRRDDLVLTGVTLTSVLAIGTAAFMMFSGPTESRDNPIAPLAATAPTAAPATETEPLAAAIPLPATSAPAMLPIATAPFATAPFAAAPLAAAVDRATPTPRQRSVARTTTTPTAHRARVARARHNARGLASRGLAPRVVARRAVAPVSEPEDYARPRLISPERGRKGKVVLLVEVRKNGKVGDVDVLSSDLDRDNRSHRDLQRAAISTVKRWRYEPAMRDGAPADSQIRVVVNIDLDSQRMIGPATVASARRRATAADREADTVLAVR